MKRRVWSLVSCCTLVLAAQAAESQITPRPFDPPDKTEWVPEGCRAVPRASQVLPSRAAWRNLHSDEINTDEVSIALTPVFAADWVAESNDGGPFTGTWNTTGPVFDSAGNLYFAPFIPFEDVVLISLDPEDGSRRFAIPQTTDAPAGAGTPMILEDPDRPGREIVYQGLYDRALALETDGTVLWDVPTGLPGTDPQFVFGVNYAPNADAIVGLTRDGFVYALDRRTGAPLLDAPFQLPGEKSPPGPPSPLPVEVQTCVAVTFSTLVDVPPQGFRELQDVLLGNNTEVANMFSIDARRSRIWIAATAPPEGGGEVSELGALYALELVPRVGRDDDDDDDDDDGGGHRVTRYDVQEVCRATFEGGSASTPALRADGSRVYVGDNFGKLIAIDAADCSRAWELDVGAQIFGSIGVSSDNDELYGATAQGIVQVIDEGDRGVLRWTADIDAFELAPIPGLTNLNLNLVSIGANGVFVQIGAGFPPNLALTVGIGLVDRDTGALRFFAPGLEETVAVMSTGPDGAIYVGNSPFRRILAECASRFPAGSPLLPFGGPPLVTGITKFRPERLDLLVRDGACAGADRAANGFANRKVCRVGAADADATQIRELIAQAQVAGPQAVDDGDLSSSEWERIRRRLAAADLALHLLGGKGLGLAEKPLRAACDAFD